MQISGRSDIQRHCLSIEQMLVIIIDVEQLQAPNC